MLWLKQALTGPDNQTVAIGRLIGMVIAVVLLVAIPLLSVANVLVAAQADKMTRAQAWHELLIALGVYVPTVAGAIWGLVWGTNSTEPKPKDKTDA
jgi:hypothetical protein